MIPRFKDVFYPMTADIYYSQKVQGELGDINLQWVLDRTVACSAIKERAEYNAKYSVQADKFVEFNFKVNMRTQDSLLIGFDGTLYRPTEVLITNIKDASGNPVWEETPSVSTTFELESIEPMFDHTSTLFGYRAMLSRSDQQW